jgi:hypothetical protein
MTHDHETTERRPRRYSSNLPLMLPCRLAALGVVLLVFVTITAACADDSTTGAMTADAGGTLGSLGDSVCPDAAPDAGDGCVLPDGTTCAFGACGSPIARCLAGAWRYSGNSRPRPQCPKDFPASEAACPPCWPVEVSCTYGSSDCSAADASANTTVASCPDGRWTLSTFPCGILDAGADVQGDAGPDAD